MAHPLLSLFLIVTVLGFFGFVGYIVYSIAQDVASKAAKKMEDKNIRFSKDGMKVGIREKDARDEDAQVQRYVHYGIKLNMVFGSGRVNKSGGSSALRSLQRMEQFLTLSAALIRPQLDVNFTVYAAFADFS